MDDKKEENRRIGSSVIRITYILICLVITFFYFKHEKVFINESSIGLDYLSYYGFWATIIALIVTVFEIIYNTYISQNLKIQSHRLLNNFKDIQETTVKTHCINIINEVNDCLKEDNNTLAIQKWKHLRNSYSLNPRKKTKGTEGIHNFEVLLENQFDPTRQLKLGLLTRKLVELKRIIEE